MFCVYAVMYDLTHSDDSIFILMLNTMCYFYMSSVICKVGSLILLNFFVLLTFICLCGRMAFAVVLSSQIVLVSVHF